jgi:hypothetical protein
MCVKGILHLITCVWIASNLIACTWGTSGIIACEFLVSSFLITHVWVTSSLISCEYLASYPLLNISFVLMVYPKKIGRTFMGWHKRQNILHNIQLYQVPCKTSIQRVTHLIYGSIVFKTYEVLTSVRPTVYHVWRSHPPRCWPVCIYSKLQFLMYRLGRHPQNFSITFTCFYARPRTPPSPLLFLFLANWM